VVSADATNFLFFYNIEIGFAPLSEQHQFNSPRRVNVIGGVCRGAITRQYAILQAD
jgi:hypothetical protein